MAIETKYAGHLFRSRLEARWAALFDRIGWRWEYEPMDCDGYIPDFLIQGPVPFLVEVKPDVTIEELEWHEQRIVMAVQAHWARELIIVGGCLSPEPKIAGIRRFNDPLGVSMGNGPADMAVWVLCPACRQVGWQAHMGVEEENTIVHPCGHTNNSFCGLIEVIRGTKLRDAWGGAHELTRWTR